MTRRSAAWGGIIGPAAFIGAWALGGAITSGYSPVEDAISRLAAVHAETRPLMTAGFVIFGVGLPVYACALRDALAGPAWCTAAAAGIATLLVAAAPLDHSATVDTLHGVFAGTGYVALALTPLLAIRPLRSAARIGLDARERRRGRRVRHLPRAHDGRKRARPVPASRPDDRRCVDHRDRRGNRARPPPARTEKLALHPVERGA